MNTKLVKTLISASLLSVLSFLASINLSFAEIYKWNDMQGNIRYSDIPPETSEGTNIEEVNIKNRVNTYSNDNSQNQKPLIERKADAAYDKQVKEKTLDYKKEIDRSKDEDVSAVIREFKKGAKSSADTADQADVNKTSDSGNTNDTSGSSNTDINNNSDGQNTSGDDINSSGGYDNQSSPAIEPQGKNNFTLPMSNKEIKQAKNCATAQQNLEKLTSNNIIVAKNNKLQKLNDSEIDIKIKEARSQIAFYC